MRLTFTDVFRNINVLRFTTWARYFVRAFSEMIFYFPIRRIFLLESDNAKIAVEYSSNTKKLKFQYT